jgi:hypothetical protein
MYESESYYEMAQVCKNGHSITGRYNGSPALRQDFCSKCGQPTITKCEKCGESIRGKYIVAGIGDMTKFNPPSFCHKCGSAYPWTTKKIEAFSELADELDELSDDEKAKLKLSLDDLINTSPKTQLAETHFKKILSKVSKESYDLVKGVLTDILSETIKKSIFKQ